MAPSGSEGARSDTNVLVAVRCRPFNGREKASSEPSCVRILGEQIALINPAGNGDDHSFGFDLIFDDASKQDDVWKEVGLPILNKALSGYNGTIFAYGQTGSGKTWSMQGGEGDLMGIIPRMNAAMFERIAEEKRSRPTVQFLVTASYFEIYNEVIFDLLDPSDRKKRANSNKGGLEIKEHPALGVYVKGLQEIVTESAEQLEAIIEQGQKHRTVASTQMNADSSRSHSVFIISIHQKDEANAGSNVFAKMNLVDLAGSERVKSTGATGATLKEGANINKSLSELGNVINALVECSKGKAVFIPYRNSKLTRVLQESLGGNSITSMLAALSPAACNFEETLSTLKYANRAKAIKVKAVKNEEATQINRLQDEIRALKEKLQQQTTAGDGDGGEVMDEKARARLRDLEEAARNTWEQKAQLSSQYEHDRAQLVAEQQYALRQLVLAKEKAWNVMVQKDSMDAVILHLKEGLATAKEEAVAAGMQLRPVAPDPARPRTIGGDESGAVGAVSAETCGQLPVLLAVCDHWLVALQHLSASEKSVREEFLVVNMVRSALLADAQTLSKVLDSGKTQDHGYLHNILEQVKDKVSSLGDALPKCLRLQNHAELLFRNLHTQYAHVLREYQRFCAQLTAPSEPQADALRCLELLAVQVQRKAALSLQLASSSRRAAMAFSPLIAEVDKVVAVYSQHLTALRSESEDLAQTPASDEVRGQHELIAEQLGGCAAALAEIHALGVAHAASFQTIDAQVAAAAAAAPSVALALPAVESKTAPLTFALIRQQLTAARLPTCGLTLAELRARIAQLPHATNSAGGDAESLVPATEAALGEVMSWEKLLGAKHSPQKLLQRPPVRFLFDLMQHLAAAAGGPSEMVTVLGEEALDRPATWQANGAAEALAVLTGDWAVVNASKEAKLAFMERLLRFVGLCVGDEEPPVTTAVNIVTGSRPDLSNAFLQLLALVVRLIQQHFQSSPPTVAATTTEPARDVVAAASALLPDEAVLGFARALRALVDASVASVRAVLACELQTRALRQDLQRRNMEALAQEKAQLAQALAHEKQSLLSNNQSLSDQVTAYEAQVGEMKRLMEKESEYSATMAAMKRALEDELAQRQQELRDKEEQAQRLASQIFKLEAGAERDRALLAGAQQAQAQAHARAEELAAALQRQGADLEALQAEREERENNILILTEERDAARQHEEELFEGLTEVTLSLENLQESYVTVNDRCNDLFDENLELKDELVRLRDALLDAQRQALASSLAAKPTQPAALPSPTRADDPKPSPLPTPKDAKRTGSKASPMKAVAPTPAPVFAVGDVEQPMVSRSAPGSMHARATGTLSSSSLPSAAAAGKDEDDYQEDFDDES